MMIRKLARATAALGLAAGLLLAAGGPAGASRPPHHAASARPAAACNLCCDNAWAWQLNGSQWTWKVKWTDNLDACYIQSALKCTSPYNTSVWVHGGWVEQTGLWSGVDCPPNFRTPVQANLNWAQAPGPNYEYYVIYRA